MTRNVRRVAAGTILIAVACNVYDPSLLVGTGNASGATGGTDFPGGTGGGGIGGSTGGNGGSMGGSTGGVPVVGGAAGTAASNSGTSGAGGVSGTGGSENIAGEAGEAGMMGEGGTGGAGGAGGSAGKAGSGGKGGSAGTGAGGMETGGSSGAGMSGTTGVSGSGGSAGSSAGMAGAGGSGGSGRTSCAVLTVPLAASADKSHFDISFTPTIDLSAATITIQLNVSAGNGGIIDPFVQDASYHFLNPASVQQISSFTSAGWTKPIVWNVGTEPPRSTSIAKGTIKRIGIEISANNASASTLANTIAYVDSITIDTPTESLTFDASGSVNGTLSGDPSNTSMWVNSADTPVANTTVSWQDACP